ncbi:MAG: coenzyme F420-0:L-glutamate ligase [Actinomycetia bacterium]|nr:coenzyme F420-0:L-glutamate ligase [Actinomycetes bacterium]
MTEPNVMAPHTALTIIPVPGVPEIREGDDLPKLLSAAIRGCGEQLRAGDILVLASKVLSKSLGLRRHGTRDQAIAEETLRVVCERRAGDRWTRVVEAAAGPVMAAAGVDASNVGDDGGVLVLPRDPDAAAARILDGLRAALDWAPTEPLGLIISDTAGRPWRGGVSDFALGSAGVHVLNDHRGGTDADGRVLDVTVIAVADEIAAAADLVKAKSSATPLAIVRGLPWASATPGLPGARQLVRTGPGDWFRVGHIEAVRAALGVDPGSSDSERIGIRGPALDPLEARVARLVRLALHGTGTGTGTDTDTDAGRLNAGTGTTADTNTNTNISTDQINVTVTGPEIRLTAADPYLRGRLHARLEVAAYAEDLRVSAWREESDSVLLTFIERG